MKDKVDKRTEHNEEEQTEKCRSICLKEKKNSDECEKTKTKLDVSIDSKFLKVGN